MSEWLTTGQMIDRLKIGEKAEPVEFPLKGNYQKDYVVNNGNQFNWERTNGGLVINDFINAIKWRILPNYVSFDEAMRALEEGKTVRFVDKDFGSSLYQFNSPVQGLSSHSWGEMIQGKWTIEDD